MRIFIFLFSLLALYKSNLEILLPEGLRSSFKLNKTEGNINYTVSTFGNISFTEIEYVQVLLPPENNKYGCNSLEKPFNFNGSDKFIWLVKRGECTYSKKAFIAQQSGAYAVLVYHNQSHVDINNVIPCADSICKVIR